MVTIELGPLVFGEKDLDKYTLGKKTYIIVIKSV